MNWCWFWGWGFNRYGRFFFFYILTIFRWHLFMEIVKSTTTSGQISDTSGQKKSTKYSPSKLKLAFLKSVLLRFKNWRRRATWASKKHSFLKKKKWKCSAKFEKYFWVLEQTWLPYQFTFFFSFSLVNEVRGGPFNLHDDKHSLFL